MKREVLIESVIKLIWGYERHNLGHSLISCPLCLKFYKKNDGDENCGSCPNQIFAKPEQNYFDEKPCVRRGKIFEKLEYRLDENDIYLAEFWVEVLELIKVTDEIELQELSNEFREKVLAIASKYK